MIQMTVKKLYDRLKELMDEGFENRELLIVDDINETHYRDTLNKFNETGLKIWEVLCAAEVEARMPGLTENMFEYVTDFVYNWVMNSEIMPAELLSYIATGLADKDFTLEDFTTFDGQEEITRVINLMI